MKATIRQASNNERSLQILPQGRGHYKISMDYRGKRISTITTDSSSVDAFRADPYEKDSDGYNLVKQGYQNLCSQIIRDNY